MSNRRKLARRNRVRSYFADLEGYRCGGCDQPAMHVDQPDGRLWFVAHHPDCPAVANSPTTEVSLDDA